MRIGLVLNLDRRGGGVYQYTMTLLDGLLSLKKGMEINDEFLLFADDIFDPNLKNFKKEGWKIIPLHKTTRYKSSISKLIKNTFLEELAGLCLSFMKNTTGKESKSVLNNVPDLDLKQRQWFLDHKVELMIYPTANAISFRTMIPYIFAVHDVQHRIHPEFPEVSADGEWEGREYGFFNGIKNALLILVDSEVGKEDVLNYYQKTAVKPDRIKILPFMYTSYLGELEQNRTKVILKSLKLPGEYLFYPAQFWPHKNHLRLVKALALIRDKLNLEIPLVLCGSHAGKIREQTFKEVMDEAEKLKVDKNVFYLGYVNDEYMSAFYKGAKAMIMPTFFGPTNIPILEAWYLGCPAITSDIRGVRDQAGDAALLVDPYSAQSIAEAIEKIWFDENLRAKLIVKGKKRLALYTMEDYRKRLKLILEDAKRKISKQ